MKILFLSGLFFGACCAPGAPELSPLEHILRNSVRVVDEHQVERMYKAIVALNADTQAYPQGIDWWHACWVGDNPWYDRGVQIRKQQIEKICASLSSEQRRILLQKLERDFGASSTRDISNFELLLGIEDLVKLPLSCTVFAVAQLLDLRYSADEIERYVNNDGAILLALIQDLPSTDPMKKQYSQMLDRLNACYGTRAVMTLLSRKAIERQRAAKIARHHPAVQGSS